MAYETPVSETHIPSGLDAPLEGAVPAPRRRESLSFLDILVILAERKRVIFWITAAFTLLAVAISLLLPNRYTATVTVLPPQQESSLGAMLSSELSSAGGSSLGGMAALASGSLGLKNPNEHYVGMLRSHVVEDAVIRQFGLQAEYHQKLLSDTRRSFEKRSKVDGSAKDGFIHISVEDHDPRKAMEIANGYVAQFRKLSEGLASSEASQRRAFFAQQLDQAKTNLTNAEQAMKETEQKTGMIEIGAQTSALIGSVASLRAQIATREMIIQGVQSYATGQNAQLIQEQKELDSLRGQLKRLGGSEDNTDSVILPKGLVPQIGMEYLRKLRDVKYYEAIFDILARQYELAKLDEAREGAIIQVVDPAILPDKKSSPQRALIVGGGFLAGLMVALLAVFGIETVRRWKDDSESADKLHRIRIAMRSGLRR